jgi:prephenate dehydrogenase
MRTVAIVGLGLIGGSLGQALRRTKRYRVIGISRGAANARAAKKAGAVDVASHQGSDVSSADIVVICSPVDRIVPLLKTLLPSMKSDAIVTDVGSVKGSIMRDVARIPGVKRIQFVGGHPLAGSHKTGVKAAHWRLFERSTVVLVPGARAALKPLKSLWNAVGAKVMIMSAAEHDRAVALISHLPHALAHALVHVLARRKERAKLIPLLAGSFRDGTRVASSDPEQWAQIFQANAGSVKAALKDFRRELAQLESNLSQPQLVKHLKKSQAFRRPLFNGI